MNTQVQTSLRQTHRRTRHTTRHTDGPESAHTERAHDAGECGEVGHRPGHGTRHHHRAHSDTALDRALTATTLRASTRERGHVSAGTRECGHLVYKGCTAIRFVDWSRVSGLEREPIKSRAR